MMFRWFRKTTCPAACREGHTYGATCLMVTSPKARAERLEALLGADGLLMLLRVHERREKR